MHASPTFVRAGQICMSCLFLISSTGARANSKESHLGVKTPLVASGWLAGFWFSFFFHLTSPAAARLCKGLEASSAGQGPETRLPKPGTSSFSWDELKLCQGGSAHPALQTRRKSTWREARLVPCRGRRSRGRRRAVGEPAERREPHFAPKVSAGCATPGGKSNPGNSRA